jgi:quinol monooxygenase YgiN
MLAWRTTWIVKPRCMEKAIEFFETEAQKGLPKNGTFRVYTPHHSPNVLVFEEAWETEQEHDKYWVDLNAAPETAAMWDRLFTIVENSTGTELWDLREWR